MGLSGLEVAPSRVWKETGTRLTAQMVSQYRKIVEAAGLEVVGLHSLLFDQPSLGLFRSKEARKLTLGFMEHLSKVCRDLGGKTLVYGGGRWRNGMPIEDAFSEAKEFFAELFDRTELHGTIFCIEPLSTSDSDFINSALESLSLVRDLGHPGLQIQLDAKALNENNEIKSDIFSAVAPYLVHVHVNEPNLGILGASGQINNEDLADQLNAINYEGYVSIEQKMINDYDPIFALNKSARVLREFYS